MTAISARRRGTRSVDWLPPLVVFVAVLITWEVSFTILQVPVFLIPRPSVIWTSLQAEFPTLWKGALYTASEAIGGLVVGVGLGTLAGLAGSRWATARDTLVPLGTAMSAVPIIALAPIMIDWFGFESQLPRIAIVALMTFFPVLVNTVRGLRSVDAPALELMASYAATEREVLRKVRIPSALPYWFVALRIAVTLAVIGAVVGEFFGGPRYSIGIYVTDSAGNFRFENAWAAIVVACALGIVLYLAAVAVERVAIPWQRWREAATAE
ncbi:MAG TPA: ABC transporter permease [Candidatus Limnocylindrales bacterium]